MYQLIEIEVTQPLPEIKTEANHTGIALKLRYRDRPVGLILQEINPETTLSPEALADLIQAEIGTKIVQEKLRDVLSPALDLDAFPFLTVAICTKDRPENVERCLKSLIPLQIPDNTPRFEILIVDNAPSDDQTKNKVAQFPSVGYTCEPKAGLDFARNHALAIATGEFLAFLDDDVVVDRGWYDGLRTAWAENPDAGGFTGLVMPYELETEAQILFERRGGFGRGYEKIRHSQIAPGNPLYPCGAGIFGAGCNMAFRRALLLEIGGFDDALDTGRPLPGGGDLDIFYRVVRSGAPFIYEPRYLVYHQHRRDLAGLQRQYWSWGLGFMAFVTKSYESDRENQGKFRALVWWWFRDQVKQLIKSVLGQHSLPPKMILAELWGGIQGLFGEYGRSRRRVAKIWAMTPNNSAISEVNPALVSSNSHE